MSKSPKRALLVGSSFSAAPIFFALKQYGLQVAVCGSRPEDPCHQYSDQSCFIDYSDREKLLALVETEKFDYLVPSCNDFAYVASAWVAEKLGYPGFDSNEVTNILHTKDRFRKVTEANQLRAPRARAVRLDQLESAQDLSFPLLVKPIDSFSGRGVSKVEDEKMLTAAIEVAISSSRSNSAVLEEFVGGGLHSHSAFIKDKAVLHDFFVDEYCTVYPYQVNCSNHPSALSEKIRAGVREDINRLVSILKLEDGLLHTQFIADRDQFWLIECMRRCPGDLYPELIERSTGFLYTDSYVRPFIGLSLSSHVQQQAVKYVGRHTISTDAAQVCHSFACNVPANEVSIVPLKISGEKLGAAPFDKLAILFARFSTMQDLSSVTPRFAETIDFQSL